MIESSIFDAEQQVLGALFLNPECVNEISEIIPSGVMFLDPRNVIIYDTILDFFESGEKIDLISIAVKVKNQREIPVDYIANIIDATPYSAMVKSHARIVRDQFRLREIRELSKNLAAQTEIVNDVSELPESISDDLFRVLADYSQKKTVGIGDAAEEALAQSLAREQGKIRPVMTGYPKLDELMGGMNPGDLTVLAARTSKGKSSLGINIADNITTKDPGAVAVYFALELSASDIASRLIAHRSGMGVTTIRNGTLSFYADGWNRVKAARESLRRSNLIISDTPAVSVAEIRATLRNVKLKHKRLDIVFIDHAGLMKAPGAKRHEQLESITRGLKALAKEFHIPMFCIAQINRESVKKEGGQPELHEIKGSGSYEEDAQQVLLLSKQFSDDGIDPATVRVEKNTHGACGKVDMMFASRFTRFEEV